MAAPNKIEIRRKAKEERRAMRAQARYLARKLRKPSKSTSARDALVPIDVGVEKAYPTSIGGSKQQGGPLPVTSGYAFVIETQNGGWLYLRLDGDHTISATSEPRQVYSSVTEEMRELWRRIVIDEAIPFDCYGMRQKSVRLVSLEMAVEDCTQLLFDDSAQAEQRARWAALSKLTDEDAKLLGVEHDYALMKLFQRPGRDADDIRMIDDLRQRAAALELCPPLKAK